MAKLQVESIRDLYRNIRKAIDFENAKPKEVKNITQMQILFYLLNNVDNVVYQKDIGEAIKLRKSSITENLDYLEMIGAVERTQDINDKRKNSVRLSKAALKRKSEIDNSIKYLNAKVIAGISKEELAIFEKVVNKMEENLK